MPVEPPSPCTGICRIDSGTGWCRGCGRTIEEIGRWPAATSLEKASLLEVLPDRMARMRPGRSAED
ncbi:DUF1289 domain-containing protein [Sphingosinicella terrae]|uniref:DUF1289 domain-containing protein n=1 Tax=Sphingosinicella terrae TaxID=2172047 RepID=UPI000E0D3E7A|nr:DUF1289 domain-containing protein [Sphingosinicella terrae]